MSRASRMLKWAGAITVLLAAAPIAYADPSPAAGANPPPEPPAWCGDSDAYAATHTVAGLTDTAYRFELFSLRTTQLYFGTPAPPGVWLAGGGTIVWTEDGRTFRVRSDGSACAGTASAGLVASFTTRTVGAADRLTPQQR